MENNAGEVIMKDSLQEGKQYCDQCDGEGLVKEKPFYPGGEKILNLCRKCKGSGQLDWVEMVVGKRDIILNLKKMRPGGTRIGKDLTLMNIKLKPRRIREENK